MGMSKVDLGAVGVGLLVTILLSATMVIAGLKAGITPGVSPLVVLCCWGGLSRVVQGPNGVRFLNLAQVAGSSGMAIVSGVIFSEPLLQVLHLDRAQKALRSLGIMESLKTLPWDAAKKLMAENGLEPQPVDVPTTLLACVCGTLIGAGVVGLATKKFLSDPALPAPEAQACRTLVMAATDKDGQQPNLVVSLVVSTVASFVAPFISYTSLAMGAVTLMHKESATTGSSFAVELPFSSTYIGIGGLLTISTSLVMFCGAVIRLSGDYMLASMQAPPEGVHNPWPNDSMRWVGGGAMTVAVLYSLVRFFRPKKSKKYELTDKEEALLSIGRRGVQTQATAIVTGALILTIWLFETDGINKFSMSMIIVLLITCMLMVILGAVLSLQIGSSASPVSGTVFITTLILCITAGAAGRNHIDDVPILTVLLTTACVAVCCANDASQDYKTLQLCNLPPREAFLAQMIGLLVGSCVVPFSLYVANEAYGIGTTRLTAPQGQMFAVLVDGILLTSNIPWHPVMVGLAIGVVFVGLDYGGEKCLGLSLPAMAAAVGLYLPADSGIGIMIGSIARFIGETQRESAIGRPERTHESILAATGLITGSALTDLILGIATLFGFNIRSMKLFTEKGEEGMMSLPKWVMEAIAMLGILALAAIIWYNSLNGVAELEPDPYDGPGPSESDESDGVCAAGGGCGNYDSESE